MFIVNLLQIAIEKNTKDNEALDAIGEVEYSNPVIFCVCVHILYYLLISQSVPWCKATRIMAEICYKFESH